jgi:dihydrolipoamide dehydrogenase
VRLTGYRIATIRRLYRLGKAWAEAEVVMLAVGRAPVLPIGTEEIGIKTVRGSPVVNAALQTSYPHIYAPGDVNGRSMLFHSAVRQSLIAAENILHANQPVEYMDWDATPTTIFTFPEAASVGLTRNAVKSQGLEVVEAGYNFAEDSRAQILDEAQGELRLFFEAGSLRLRGDGL